MKLPGWVRRNETLPGVLVRRALGVGYLLVAKIQFFEVGLPVASRVDSHNLHKRPPNRMACAGKPPGLTGWPIITPSTMSVNLMLSRRPKRMATLRKRSPAGGAQLGQAALAAAGRPLGAGLLAVAVQERMELVE